MSAPTSPWRPSLRRLMRPGLQVMLQLRMPAKLGLLTAIVVVPLALLAARAVDTLLTQRSAATARIAGATRSAQLTALMAELQRHRELTHLVLLGDRGAVAARDETRRLLRAALDTTDRALTSPDDRMPVQGRVADAWRAVRGHAGELAAGQHPTEAASAFALHTRVIESVRDLIRLDGDHSGLLHDPDAHTGSLVALNTDALLPAIEAAAAARGIGAEALLHGGATVAERATLLGTAGALDHHMSAAANHLAILQGSGGAAPLSWPAARTRATGYAALIRNVFGGVEADASSDPHKSYFDLGTEVVGQLVTLHAEAAEMQQRLLAAQRSALDRELAMLATGLILAAALLVYALAALYLTLRDNFAALLRATNAVAGGDLSHRMHPCGRDELAEIERNVEQMSGHLSSLVAEIRNSAARVDMAGAQVADGSMQLSDRTQTQATNLRQSVHAIEQLRDTLQTNAQAAHEIDQLTGRLARHADDGHGAMTEAMQAMQGMREATQRVFEVIGVIDEVAFQTGMLSLNAAVEAARAGEAGRGFSVVASEVRQLAQRASESADEIRTLITDAGLRLQATGSKLADADAAIGTLVEGVREVSSQLRGMAAAGTRQSETLTEITASVGCLEELTRENAALVEQAAASSHELMNRAEALRTAVAAVRLRQGSSDEARALLDRAREHLERVGREQGLADLHKPELGFIDRDLYVFALDRAGVYIACGAKPENVGTNVNLLPGIAGTNFVDKVWAAAQRGGGWVPYEIANPLTGEVTPKESYVIGLDNGLLLGCGIYRRAASGSAAEDDAAGPDWSAAAALPEPVTS